MFILTISYLTTSNFPWFIGLTFQVPIQYCSLQHQILLSSPDTSTTECRIRFGPTSSFILGLLVILLHSSPVAYWTFRRGGLIFQCLISLSFYTVHEVLTANILGWFTIPSSSGREWEDTWAEESHIILEKPLQAGYSLLESKWRKLICRWRMTISFEKESITKLN